MHRDDDGGVGVGGEDVTLGARGGGGFREGSRGCALRNEQDLVESERGGEKERSFFLQN